MQRSQFEKLLDDVVARLQVDVRSSRAYHHPEAFEKRVLEVMQEAAQDLSIVIKETFHPHAFPDIVGNGFGVEVKSTRKDAWFALGNSILEGMRDQGVADVYVVFGKMGGTPEVKWSRYEECIKRIRVSHAPRFALQMDEECMLFSELGIPYADFAKLPPDKKMRRVREWARGWLQEGQQLWWIEDEDRGLPFEVTLYMTLPRDEKDILRAEAALLCPQIVGRGQYRYAKPALYLLTYHGVLISNARDGFTAGSVALRGGRRKGGKYLLQALMDIQNEMRRAAGYLDDALFVEFWGESVPPHDRIRRWLQRADKYAVDWKPSRHLFLTDQSADMS